MRFHCHMGCKTTIKAVQRDSGMYSAVKRRMKDRGNLLTISTGEGESTSCIRLMFMNGGETPMLPEMLDNSGALFGARPV